MFRIKWLARWFIHSKLGQIFPSKGSAGYVVKDNNKSYTGNWRSTGRSCPGRPTTWQHSQHNLYWYKFDLLYYAILENREIPTTKIPIVWSQFDFVFHKTWSTLRFTVKKKSKRAWYRSGLKEDGKPAPNTRRGLKKNGSWENFNNFFLKK